jgi:protease-4
VTMSPFSRILPALPAVLSALFCWIVPVQGQFHRATDPVSTPPHALAGQDDALAMDVNPAAIGLLPYWSLAYLHSQAGEGESWLGTGDAVFAASPLFRGLAVGGSLQSVRSHAPEGLSPELGELRRGMGAIVIAYAPSGALGLGASARALYSSNPGIDGLATSDFGALWRPASWLGLSLVGRDLLASREGLGTGGLELGPSAVLSTLLRPLGTGDLALELAVAVDHENRVGGRGALLIPVPYVGSASAIAEVENLADSEASLRVMGGLSVHWGKVTAAGGAFAPSDFDGEVGWFAMAGVQGASRPGIPQPRCALEVEIADLSASSMAELTLVMERALFDPRVAGVVLRPRSRSMSMAYAQEVRKLIAALRSAGKPVLCHLSSASGSEYYACADVERIVIDPAGSLRLMGTSLNVVLLGDTLQKIGVRADFVRIGPYKSAPEQLEQNQLSEAAREQNQALLDDVYRRLTADLSSDLGISRQRVIELVDEGPRSAARALTDELVAGTADELDLESDLRRAIGEYPLRSELGKTAPRGWGRGPSIAVVLVEGSIVDGDSVDIPLLDIHLSGGRTISKTIRALASDPAVAAIVVRVDSPGGEVMASDQIWRAVRAARQRKPVIASLGSVAASGGYYVASAASEIWAAPSTVTGSIGIFYGKVDVEKLADYIGVNVEFFKRGRFAGSDTVWRPYTPEERALLAESIRSYYRLFLQRISESRGMSVEKIDAVGRGRVYSGERALEKGLIDHLGGLAAALSRARDLAGVARDTPALVLPEHKPDLMSCIVDQVLGGTAGTSSCSGSASGVSCLKLPRDITATLGLFATFCRAGGGRPLAIMPYVVRVEL